MVLSGSVRPATQSHARRKRCLRRLTGQPVQQLSAYLTALGPLVAAVHAAAAQGYDPFCVVGCGSAFFQRYDVVCLQVPCCDAPLCQAQSAQLVIPPVYFCAGFLPSVSVAHSSLRGAASGSCWLTRAYIPTRVHPPAPLAAHLHFFLGLLYVQHPAGHSRTTGRTHRGREHTPQSAPRICHTQPAQRCFLRVIGFACSSKCCTPQNKKRTAQLSSRFSMILILARKMLAQCQLSGKTHADSHILQISAAPAVEVPPADSRHVKPFVYPDAAICAVECNRLFQCLARVLILYVCPDFLCSGINGAHDLHIPLLLQLVNGLGLVGRSVAGAAFGARHIHTHRLSGPVLRIYKAGPRVGDDLPHLLFVRCPAPVLPAHQLQRSQNSIIRQSFVFSHACVPPLFPVRQPVHHRHNSRYKPASNCQHAAEAYHCPRGRNAQQDAIGKSLCHHSRTPSASSAKASSARRNAVRNFSALSVSPASCTVSARSSSFPAASCSWSNSSPKRTALSSAAIFIRRAVSSA
nr:MAG TPA: hypothetical protein [Caudoviricetes sp.]